MKSRTLLTAAVVLAGFTLDLPTAQGASLLHHWKFDGDATDSVGSDNGTEEGGATYTTGDGGQFGEAVSLDGVDDAIRTGTSPVPATDYTLTAWVFWEAGNTHRGSIAGAQRSGSEGEVFTLSRATDPKATDRKLFLNLLPNGGSSITESPDNTVSTNVWQHVAYSVSSTAGVTLYLDGAVVGTNPALTTHTPSSLDNFTIGARPDSTTANPGWFDGLIDDVAIFDGVLDGTQLTNVINLGAENFDGLNAPVPVLTATNPVTGETDAVISTNLVASFDQVVRAGTSGSIVLRRTAPDELVEVFDVTSSPGLGFESNTVTIDPASDLLPGVEYYVLIDAGAIEDLAGNGYPGLSAAPPDSAAWSFTADDTPPASSGMSPMNGADNSLPTDDLTLGFDEDVSAGSGTIEIFLADGTPVETIDVTTVAVTINGSEVTIDIGDLMLNTAYYVNVSAGAFTDLSGNPFAGLSGTSAWAFTTAPTFLIHHWEFEGDATDSVGSHDGTLEGDTSFAPGLFGQAASLDGDGDSIFVNQSSLLATDFTMSAWVNPADVSTFNFVVGTQQSDNAGAFLRVDDGVVFVNLLPPADSKRASGGTVPLSNWTHLAVTVDSVNGLTIYVDGSPVATDPAGTGHTTHDNFRIGARPDTGVEPFGFDGLIDDLRIYAEALSESEIAALADITTPLALKVSRNGDMLDFEWNSMSGMQYDLVSSTDLSTDRTTWPVYDDGVNPPHENIRNTGTTTGLTGVVPLGTVRFFALIEEEIPPLFSEDFEADNGGFTVIDHSAGGAGSDWMWGAPDSNGGAGGGAVNTGAGSPPSAKCWGTNIGTPGVYATGTDTSLISPVIDLSSVTGATLSFAQAIDILSPDALAVRIIDDDINGGITVIGTPLHTADDVGTVNEADWQPVSGLDLSAGLGQPVRIEWRFTGDGDGTYIGAYIDDVVVTETTP